MQIRIFTEKGMEAFSKYISGLNDPVNLNLPDLNNEPYSTVFNSKLEIDEDKKFSTRMDIGKYLSKLFKQNKIETSEVAGNNNLWTWLAYIWFKQLCNKRSGVYRVYEVPKYICSSSWNRYYRHFIAIPYFLVSLHGEKYSKLFLNSPPHIHNDFTEQLVSSQNIIASQNIVKVIHELYWDEKSDKPLTGALGKKRTDAGSVRRLRVIFNQLRLTYDLNSMDEKGILDLLPTEFDKYRK